MKLHVHHYKTISTLEAVREIKKNYTTAGVSFDKASKCRCGHMKLD